jgi:hypothetical protein
MAISVVESKVGSVTSGNTLSFSSWTPSAYDLLLVFVVTRDTSSDVVSDLSGNGLTWTSIKNVKNDESKFRIRLYRSMGSSPSAGAVTATLDSNSDPAIILGVRFSGCDTSGVNGSGAVDVSKSDDGPSSQNNDMKESITSISENSWCVAFGSHRDSVFTVPGGETAISINNTAGSGSDEVSASVWYQVLTSPDTVTLGDDGDLDSNDDWAMIVVSLKESLVEVAEIVDEDYVRFLNRVRRVDFKTSGDDFITSAFGACHALTSEYRGNEIEGTQVTHTIRAVLRRKILQKVSIGDRIYVSPIHFYDITSIKPFENEVEILAKSQITTAGTDPDILKSFDLSTGTSETVIWQPGTDKKFRLIEVQATITGAPSCKLIFRDGSGGSVVLNGTTSNVYTTGSLGAGILSSMADNPLTLERSVSCAISGHVLGFEE